MNKKSKVIFLAAAGMIASLVLALGGVRAILGATHSAGQGQSVAPIKKASEQFKNIQVLKDLPADQLYPAMHFMADSLGVDCVDCHAGIPGRVDGEKDDKQMKLTARKMIKMTMEINNANFGGNNNRTVTCFTCHRGSRQPVATPVITDVPTPNVNSAETVPMPDQILDKYVDAIGGTDSIQKVRTIVEEGNIESGPNKIPVEIFAKAPNKRVYLKHTASGDAISTTDGASGWLRTADGNVRDMTAAEASGERLDADFSFPLQAKLAFQQIRASAPETIGDKKAYCLVARTAGTAPVKLYFDARTGLLLRVIRYTDV